MGFGFPFDDIGKAVASAGEAAGNMAADASKAVAEGAGAAAGAIGDMAVAAVDAAGDAAGDAVETVGNAAASAGEAAGNMAADASKAIAEGAGAAAGAIGDAAGMAFDAANNAAGAATGAVDEAACAVGGFATDAGNALVEGAGGVADVAGHGVDQAGHAVADAIVAAGAAAGTAAGNVAREAMGLAKGARESFTDAQALAILTACYKKAIRGIPGLNGPVQEMADRYLVRYGSAEVAVKKLIRAQVAKSVSSGFVTSIGGLITLPTAVPADIASVMYIQMRLAAALAAMSGQDVTTEQVRTLVFACLVGDDAAGLLDEAGVHIGNRVALSAIEKVPPKVLIAISNRVAFRLALGFGTKGALAVGKMVPVVGGVIGGGINARSTRAVGNAAYKMFIAEQLPTE